MEKKMILGGSVSCFDLFNLEKQFVVVPRKVFNSRIESLLGLTGLKSRMVSSREALAAADEIIDYEPVNRILEEERRRASKFRRL